MTVRLKILINTRNILRCNRYILRYACLILIILGTFDDYYHAKNSFEGKRTPFTKCQVFEI